MQFFCTKNHYEQWRQENQDKGSEMELLDMDRALEAAREIFEIRRNAAAP